MAVGQGIMKKYTAAIAALLFLGAPCLADGTGSPMALIAPTAPVGTNNNQIATTAFVQTAVGSGSLALASGQIFIGSAGNVATGQPVSGDCTITILGAITCTKTGGVAFAPSATTDATNAANISSGTLPIARLANLGTTTTVLHGNAAGNPSFGAVALGTDVSGQLPFANGGCNGTTQQTCLNNIAPTPTRAGDLMYYNGTNWVSLAGNNSGTQFLQETAAGVPSWVTVSGTGTVTQVVCGTGLSGGTITTSGTCAVNVAAKTDQQTGTSNVLAVTPLHQQDHDSAVKAWASWTGSTGALLSSYNVTSVTRNGVGQYTVNFTTAFASANYACTPGVFGPAQIFTTVEISAQSASTSQVFTAISGAATDPAAAGYASIVCFGRQ
jgi:hypothetical protein